MTRQPSLLDPADDLTQVLGPDLAKAFVAHRKAIKKPMTDYAATLMAKRLRTMPDPVGSAEQSIRNGWSDCFPVKAERAQPQIYGMDALEADLRSRINDHHGSAGEGGNRPQAAQALPQLGWQGQSRPH